MERERWWILYHLACQLSRHWPFGSRYSTACIVGVFLWAVLHDRPVCWACQAANWPAQRPFRKLPSQSTMSRRLQSDAVQQLLKLMESQVRAATARGSPEEATRIIDAKPLAVGGCSHDPQARWGRASGGLAKGYKLYAVWGASAVPDAWRIAPMNVSEKTMAERLLSRLAGHGYLLADSQYDSNKLYDLAFERGFRLLAPRRKKGDFGRHYLSPHRLLAVVLLEQTDYYREFHRQRTGIERRFGNLTSFSGGLAPLPSWVRRLSRVQLWVQAKLLINAIRIQQRELAIA